MMKHLQLWHAKQPTFMPAQENPWATGDLNPNYTPVAEFSVDEESDTVACDYVYAQSQNIDDPWCNPPRRSTSVGDLIMVMNIQCNVGTDIYEVDNIGFKKLM